VADVMRLKDNGTTKDFSPIEGYDIPEDRRRSTNIAIDGTLYIYEWGGKKRYEIPVNNISKADADDINAWWRSRTVLTFYPNYADAPGTTVSVRIVNDDMPLQMMFGFWDSKFEGVLILRQSD